MPFVLIPVRQNALSLLLAPRSGVVWALAFALLAFGPVPASAQNRRATARDIQNAVRQAGQLQRDRSYTEAVRLRQQVYDWSRELYGPRHVEFAAAAYELAKARMTLGDYGPVEPLLEEALTIFRAQRIPNDANVATILNVLATYYSQLGQVAEAENVYNECIRILQNQRDTVALSTVRYNQATLYRQMGLGVVEYGRRVADADEQRKLNAEARQHFLKARDLLLEELVLVGQMRLQPRDTRRHNREMVLGEVQLDLEQFQEADRLFASARQFWDRTFGSDTHGRDLLGQGLSRCALGRYEEALDLFRRASVLAEKTLGEDNPILPTSLALQARALAHLGRFAEAGEVMDRCQRFERRYSLRVIPTLSQTEQLSYLFRPGYLEGRNLDLALALGAASGAPSSLAERSAEWLINAKAMVHELLADRALAARDQPGALANDLKSAHAKIAALVTRLNTAADGSSDEKSAIRDLSLWVQREAALVKQLGRSRGHADRPLWIQLEDVRKVMPSDAVLVEVARFDAPTFGAKGAAAIEGAPRYAAWIIPAAGAGNVQAVDLGSAVAIETAIQQLRDTMDQAVRKIRDDIAGQAEAGLSAFAKKNNLQKDDEAYQKRLAEVVGETQKKIDDTLRTRADELLADYRKNALECARGLVHPIGSHLARAKHILLSPDAHTWLVPWGALPLPGDGPLLIEAAPITYLVSGRDLLTARPRGVQAGAPVAVGDVDYDFGVRFPADVVRHPANRLKWSAVELKGIEPHLNAYGKAEPLMLTGGNASEDKVKALHSPQTLFLSTHGVFGAVDENTFRPGQRGLLLENPLLRCHLSLAGCNRRPAADATGEDGRLYGIEVDALDLRGTDLVVLSACQTGLGDVHAGQAAAGLRQAFQLAGAKSVVATLWSVDDASTTALTIAFLKRLADGAPKAEALRRAQLELLARKEMSPPFFWAAFTLTENGSLEIERASVTP